MPDYEPLPTAPESIWVGPADAELFFDQLGISWAGGLLGILNPRVVHIPTLCGAPPPATSEITMTDIAAAFVLGPLHDAALAKLNSWVDRAVWDNNCIAVDAPTPDPVVPAPPPADLPSGPIPKSAGQSDMDTMLRWLKWVAQNIVPRSNYTGTGWMRSGTGYVDLENDDGGEWEVQPAGVKIVVSEHPEYAGRSNGGSFPVYYDLGWISLAGTFGAQAPFRLSHLEMMTYGSPDVVSRCYYNLPPGVTIWIFPIYPATPTPSFE